METMPTAHTELAASAKHCAETPKGLAKAGLARGENASGDEAGVFTQLLLQLQGRGGEATGGKARSGQSPVRLLLSLLEGLDSGSGENALQALLEQKGPEGTLELLQRGVSDIQDPGAVSGLAQLLPMLSQAKWSEIAEQLGVDPRKGGGLRAQWSQLVAGVHEAVSRRAGDAGTPLEARLTAQGGANDGTNGRNTVSPETGRSGTAAGQRAEAGIQGRSVTAEHVLRDHVGMEGSRTQMAPGNGGRQGNAGEPPFSEAAASGQRLPFAAVQNRQGSAVSGQNAAGELFRQLAGPSPDSSQAVSQAPGSGQNAGTAGIAANAQRTALHATAAEGSGNADTSTGSEQATWSSSHAGRTGAWSSAPSARGASSALTRGMEQQMVDQVAAKLSSSGNQGKSTLTLNLHPPELGRLTVKLFSEDGHMSLHMHANNQQVQEVLERHMPRLRESLQQQGIELDDAMVSADSREESGREGGDDSDPRFAARRSNRANSAPDPNDEAAPTAERTSSGTPRGTISLRV